MQERSKVNFAFFEARPLWHDDIFSSVTKMGIGGFLVRLLKIFMLLLFSATLTLSFFVVHTHLRQREREEREREREGCL